MQRSWQPSWARGRRRARARARASLKKTRNGRGLGARISHQRVILGFASEVLDRERVHSVVAHEEAVVVPVFILVVDVLAAGPHVGVLDVHVMDGFGERRDQLEELFALLVDAVDTLPRRDENLIALRERTAEREHVHATPLDRRLEHRLRLALLHLEAHDLPTVVTDHELLLLLLAHRKQLHRVPVRDRAHLFRSGRRAQNLRAVPAGDASGGSRLAPGSGRGARGRAPWRSRRCAKRGSSGPEPFSGDPYLPEDPIEFARAGASCAAKIFTRAFAGRGLAPLHPWPTCGRECSTRADLANSPWSRGSRCPVRRARLCAFGGVCIA